MRYVFVDDSALAYDGYTPLRRPMGGMEKAVIGLAHALFERGHDVKVINRVAYAHMAEGAYWAPFGDASAPKQADVLIALRKPQLMGLMRAANHRLLWVMGAPDYLTAPAHEPLWDSFGASLLFIGHNQKRAYTGKVRSIVIAPGVRRTYWEPPAPPGHVPIPMPDDYGYDPEAEAARQASEDAARKVAEAAVQEPPVIPPAHAIVTTHPNHGLLWLVDVWCRLIHPQMPTARLSVYSAVLSKGIKGEEIAADMLPILEQVMAAVKANVVILDPRNDEGMAQAYRESRVHLYPGDAGDFACWTLGESQAAGVPAVARALGGVDERIDNGSTGYIVPDDAAFANVTLQILGDDGVYENLSTAAKAVARRRPWALAAEELDNFIATLPAAG
jgi:glycosyltransferase involved in cell wall biosynthesis